MELRMSRKERDRIKLIVHVDAGKLKQSEAAEMLGMSERQLRRVISRHREQGDAGLVHRLRGRASNRRIDARLRAQAVRLIREHYGDFGPTLAAEYLEERHGIKVSRETVRTWMKQVHLWAGSRKERPHRRRRPRRPCFGDLVQMDTSEHDWFEGRGESALLIGMIDDACNWRMLRFFSSDSTETNMAMIGRWIERHGRPQSLYTDWASHFKQTPKRGQHRIEPTQIERALKELGIGLIAARSPQAKGRVERMFGILQDRLVKALRIEGIKTIEAANRFLDEHFIDQINKRFSVTPEKATDVHQSIEGLDLDAILSVQHQRSVARDYTVQFASQVYQIEKGEITRGLNNPTRVRIEERLDGSLRIRWGDRYLKYRRLGAAGCKTTRAMGELTPVGLRPPSVSSPIAIPKSNSNARRPSPNHPWK